jgi:putative copper export protein
MAASLENSWLFPMIEAVHVAALAALVGTVTLVDLRLLGVGLRRQPASQIARRLAPVTWTGLGVVAVTGAAMYLAGIQRYDSNPAFLFKMAVLVVALVFHFTVHRKATSPKIPMRPLSGRMVALLSLALWACVVLAGKAIADFDV